MAVGERGKVAVAIGVGASAGTGAALCRRFARQGLHTFVAGRTQAKIDGIINGDMMNERFPQLKQERGEDGVLSVDAIADAFWMLHTQDPTAWSLELDLRPYKEQF